MEIDVWITTLQGKVLYQKRASDHGKFSFRTPPIHRDHKPSADYEYDDEEEEDTYRVCIEHQQPAGRAHPSGTRRAVEFKLDQAFPGVRGSTGNAAKASDADRLLDTLRAMHTSLSGMIGELTRLQQRERTLTANMEHTTSRVLWLAIFSLLVTVVTCAAQYKYYEGYFKQKKLC